MHIHILGICGTFMGGVALLARASGHTVTGCDANVYPPMSTQLAEQEIGLIEGYDPAQVGIRPDVFVIGNAISRGNPLLEAILDKGLPYVSGPQWLAENILRDHWVLAVAGTHGKTTTTAMLAWLLEDAGLEPGFLVGGIPHDFGVSARLTDGAFFVIEADEYDTAFCDKRSKFLHYRPRTLVLNNLEYDHADIFPDLAAIETQFHHLVRTVPRSGRILTNAGEESLRRVLGRGCWSEIESFDCADGWEAVCRESDEAAEIRFRGESFGVARMPMSGRHNRSNALAAIAAARHAGIPPSASIRSLGQFKGIKRRMEVRGTVDDIKVYDDFAHHPTAIGLTIEGLRRSEAHGRILVVLEPRSNTMKLGVMKDRLADSVALADRVFCFADDLGWDPAAALAPLGEKARTHDRLDRLVADVVSDALPGDHILVMSNGGFGGVHGRLLDALRVRSADPADRVGTST